jgi:predicted ATPase
VLLRLQVKGFKNLRDVDVRFGPLTCFVGTNAVGKSNLFDAIQFLRHLADEEIHKAADLVRGTLSGAQNPLELFWNQDPRGRIELAAEVIVPTRARDDLGQPVEPTTNFLRYEVHFTYGATPRPRLVLEHEALEPIKKGHALEHLRFPSAPAFRNSALHGRRAGGPFLSTERAGTPAQTANGEVSVQRHIKLHQDGGSRGRPVAADPSPRTVLCGAATMDYPTIVAARREFASWKAVHMEPTSLRSLDGFGDPSSVDEHGRHIAATLARLEQGELKPGSVLKEAANRLADLIPEVKALRIDRDEVREQMSVQVQMRGTETWLRPRALSDGTLRFLALVTMQLDQESSRVLCMEEPENGIHPSSIPAVVKLFRDFVVDPELPVAPDNPLRQVILCSQSPELVRQLDVPEILFVESAQGPEGREAVVRPVKARGNWRGDALAIEPRALERLIGGSPISERLGQLDLNFEFRSARE